MKCYCESNERAYISPWSHNIYFGAEMIKAEHVHLHCFFKILKTYHLPNKFPPNSPIYNAMVFPVEVLQK